MENQHAEAKEAIDEQEPTELEKRLLAAERILRLIDQGELPYIEKVVSRAVFNAKVIDDTEVFENCEGNDELRKQLQSSSSVSAYLAMNLTGIPQATLFYSRSISINESVLLSNYFPKLITMVYSAVGLSAETCSDLDQEKLDKILKAGIPIPKDS